MRKYDPAASKSARSDYWSGKVRDLEQKISANPETGAELIPQLELAAVSDVIINGPGDRLVIKDVKASGDPPNRTTLSVAAEAGGLVLSRSEFEGDVVFSGIGSTGLRASLGGAGSIYRYKGEVKSNVGNITTFIGTGDKLYRLTFVIVEGVGYVYLRGRGTVVRDDGSKVELGN